MQQKQSSVAASITIVSWLEIILLWRMLCSQVTLAPQRQNLQNLLRTRISWPRIVGWIGTPWLLWDPMSLVWLLSGGL
ncbi:hypothetical protein COO60DRAFT_283637 [Scenedesmus sp. NREL 46B-D3]|nr:hypothetical protein COO60DRAFT_283637 [Scenedesmus sp. NREL 46B-D3]